MTRRQVDVASRLPSGSSIREIAGELVVSEATARTHVRSLMERTGSANASALAAWAVAHWQCCLYQDPSAQTPFPSDDSSSDLGRKNQQI